MWDTDPQAADASAHAEHLAILAGDRTVAGAALYFTVGGVQIAQGSVAGTRARHSASLSSAR